MGRLCETEDLTDIQTEILKTVRQFVDEKILPVATELEHADEYPHRHRRGDEGARPVRADHPRGVRRPRRVAADLRAGGRGDRARLDERLRASINTHFIVAYMLMQHGTEEQKQNYLPKMATGEVRGAFSMSEPGCGSDVAAIKTKAVREADDEDLRRSTARRCG